MTQTIEATVTATVPDFHQVRLDGDDDHKYAVTGRTGGIRWEQLREGQRVRCVVTTDSMRRVVVVLEVLG